MTIKEILTGATDLLKAIREAHDLAEKAKNPAIATLTVARGAIKNAVDNLERHVRETPPAAPASQRPSPATADGTSPAPAPATATAPAPAAQA